MNQRWFEISGRIVAIGLALFHIYTGIFGTILTQKFVHLTLVMMLAFLVKPARKTRNGEAKMGYVDLAFSLVALIIGAYIIVNYEKLIYTIGAPSSVEICLGLLILLLVLELTRRTMGWPLVIISLFFVVYALAGPYLPGLFKHRGFDISRISTYLYLTNDGIYGPAVRSVAKFVILFVILGAFLRQSGIGDYFMQAASTLFAGTRGGPAKVAVLSSSLYGTISGSSTANVVTTGSFTIPLMKGLGYTPEFAGAVEAASSTGGQLVPPIMGTVAFVMAEVVGVGYPAVMKAAIIPAILYYACLFSMVDLHSQKLGHKGEKKKIDWKTIFFNAYKVLPLALIIYLLVGLKLSLMRSAVITIFATIIISWLDKDSRIGFRKLLLALESGAKSALVVASAAACAGIVIGMVNLTGLGLRMSSIILSLAHGNLIATLILAMVACVILGMGLPTLACYLIMAVIMAPAIIQLGVDRLAAHLFVMYFACLSSITPPVALAAYAAAGISGADVWKTGWTAARVAIVGYIVPFMFVFSPLLLFNGPLHRVILAILTALLGVYSLASAIERWFLGAKLNRLMQAGLLGAAFLLIDQRGALDLIGVLLFGGMAIIQLLVIRRSSFTEVSAFGNNKD